MKVLVIYYSMYGHTLKLAQAAREGALSVDGAEVLLRRVPEFPEVKKIIEKDKNAMAIFQQQQEIPECKLDELKDADAVILGSPTRYGNMTAQMKQFIDSTAELWMQGSLEGKYAGLFTSTATTHGGQETTLVSMMLPLLHLGMIIVGVPYSVSDMLHSEARGGSPYGASTIAGHNNELQPEQEDLEIAKALGKRVAEYAYQIKK